MSVTLPNRTQYWGFSFRKIALIVGGHSESYKNERRWSEYVNNHLRAIEVREQGIVSDCKIYYYVC